MTAKEKPIRDFIRLLKSHWKQFLIALVFDALFVLLLINGRILAVGFIDLLYQILLYLPFFVQMAVSIVMFFLIMYAAAAAHGVFKYLVLMQLNEALQLHLNMQQGLRRLLSATIAAYTPLLAILVVFLLANPALNAWLAAQNPATLFVPTTIVIIILIALAIYLYTLINYLQIISLHEKSVKEAFRKAFHASFCIGSYAFYWSAIKIIAAYLVLFIVAVILFRAFAATNISYVSNIGTFKAVTSFTSYIVMYLIIVFNRVSFAKHGSVSTG